LLAPLELISSSCHIELRNSITGIVRDENKKLVGWIRYDYTNEVTANRLGCISLAEGAVDWSEYADISYNELVLGNFSYTLLVTPAQSERKADKAYHRLGVAIIQENRLWPTGERVQVF